MQYIAAIEVYKYRDSEERWDLGWVQG